MSFSVNSGSTLEIRNLTLNASTDVPLVGTTGMNVNSILIRAREDSKNIQVRLTDNATDFFTVPEGMSITIDFGSRTELPCYLRSASGACTAEIMITYE